MVNDSYVIQSLPTKYFTLIHKFMFKYKMFMYNNTYIYYIIYARLSYFIILFFLFSILKYLIIINHKFI